MPEENENKIVAEKPKSGISAVKIILIIIAVILILFVGMFIYMSIAYSYAVSAFTEKSKVAEETINSVTSNLQKQAAIEGVKCDSGELGTLTIAIRNIGTSTIDASELEAFLDNVKIPVEFSSLSPGSAKSISFSGSIKPGNYTLTVASPAGEDFKTVSCV